MYRDIYSGTLKLYGEENESTLREAFNYAASLFDLQRCEEAKVLLRKMIPVARGVLGEDAQITLMMRWVYAAALYGDDCATLDDLREAVTTLEDVERTARRVLGGAHPLVPQIERSLESSRDALRARETPSGEV